MAVTNMMMNWLTCLLLKNLILQLLELLKLIQPDLLFEERLGARSHCVRGTAVLLVLVLLELHLSVAAVHLH